MSDFGDYSDYGEDDGDWMYMEDHYDEADMLAEHTCPSPGIGWVPDYLDHDPYDYWEDLDYLSDGYYDKTKLGEGATAQDDGRKRKHQRDHHNRQSKRRRGSAGNVAAASSRPLGGMGKGPVVWRTQRERDQNHHEIVPASGKPGHKSVSLLPDWKERFKNHPGLESGRQRSFASEEPTAANEISNDGFDVGNLQSVVNMLSEDNMDALKKMMEAKGLDPSAVEAVLEDLVSGNEPDFANEEEELNEGNTDSMGGTHYAGGPDEDNLSNNALQHSDMEREGALPGRTITKNLRRKRSTPTLEESVGPHRKKREKNSIADRERSAPSPPPAPDPSVPERNLRSRQRKRR